MVRKYRINFKFRGSPEKYTRLIEASSRSAAVKKVKSMGWHKPIKISASRKHRKGRRR